MNGNEILTHAVPIWFAGSTSMPDEYAEFDADFSAENTGKFEFYIAAGSEYSLYLDGRLIGFGQYQDYPGRLIYDTLTFDAEAGEHTLRVIAWHWGVDSFTHTKRPPYVIFGLRGTAGEQALVSSETRPRGVRRDMSLIKIILSRHSWDSAANTAPQMPPTKKIPLSRRRCARPSEHRTAHMCCSRAR